MDEQPPALTPQELAAMQAAQYAETGQPQVVKIFGIMHIVLGAYGVFSTILGLIALLGMNPLMKLAGASAQIEKQAAMQKEMLPMTVIGFILGIATTALILTAGILMLKRRRAGLKWSNRYGWLSLVGKVFGIFGAVFYTYPMMKETMGKTPGAASMPGGMEWIMIGSMVFGLVIACLYPILTLILLNRPKVKDWFAAQPE